MGSKRKSGGQTPEQHTTNTPPTPTNTTPMTATYKMLPSPHDCWGIRVEGRPTVGQVITVAKRDGSTKQETVSGIVSQRGGVSLCMIVPKPPAERSNQRSGRRGGVWDPDRFNGYGAKRGGWRKRCITDGNCSSFGNGKSCGGYDCDGW